MNAPSWEQIKEVFQDALDRPPNERAQWLRGRCGDDSALQAEVESLLATHEQAGSFAEQPALAGLREGAPEPPSSVSDVHRAVRPGDRLGVYEIQAFVGAGGMGEVYRARDTRLDRSVAIKVLPAQLAADRDRFQRFEREARAVARLDHPHIGALYDVGEARGLHFLVMQYLEGETLAARLTKGPLPLDQVLRYATEVADALAHAHRRGIVHRDLKPGNILLTKTGARLLDFGLAKWRDAAPGGITGRSALATVPESLTDQGMIVGTLHYMAPEQLEGKETDARADVFAFGAVVYEMVTGNKAFDAGSSASVIAAILSTQPPAMATRQPLTPPALDQVVTTCLAKDPDERWQAAADVARQLRWIADSFSRASVASTQAGVTSGLVLARPSRRRTALAAGALAVGLATGFAIGARLRTATAPSTPTFAPLTFRRGPIGNARFAPDGQTIVYDAAWDGNPVEIYATRRDMPESRTLGLPRASVLAISSGGEMAISLGCDWPDCEGTLARVPLAGGSPRELLEHVREADWSPDGARLAVIVHGPKDVFRLESPIGTVLYQTKEGGELFHPRFSPSGDRIVFDEGGPSGESIATVDLAGHKATLATGDDIFLAWSPAGDEVWFSSAYPDKAGSAIYGVSLAGRVRLLWSGDGQMILHDISRDGRALVSRRQVRMTSGGLLAGETREHDLSAFMWSIADGLSADGRTLLLTDMAYNRRHAGMYLRRTDGSPAVKLADGGADALSPDGKWAIGSRDNASLFIVPTGPGDMKILPRGSIEVVNRVGWLPDQKRIVFSGKEPNHDWRCYVQDLNGGLPQAVTPEGVQTSTITKLIVSRDGRYVAAEDPNRTVALYAIDGGPPRAIPGILAGEEPLQWSSDERFLYVRDSGRVPAKVYRLDLATGRRELSKEIAPTDPAGVGRIYKVFMTADASTYVYSYDRLLSVLNLVEGLK